MYYVLYDRYRLRARIFKNMVKKWDCFECIHEFTTKETAFLQLTGSFWSKMSMETQKKHRFDAGQHQYHEQNNRTSRTVQRQGFNAETRLNLKT